MTQAFSQFFLTIFTMFSALNKFASALDHIGTVTDESAAAFADEARAKRKVQMAKLEASVTKAQKAK